MESANFQDQKQQVIIDPLLLQQDEDLELAVTIERSSQGELLESPYSFVREKQLRPLHVFELLRASAWNVFSLMGIFCMHFSCMLWANKTKDMELVSAYGVGATFYHAFFFSVVISMGHGLFTQASQAFGAKKYDQIGILLQKAILINLCFAAISIIIIYNAESILLFCGMLPNVANIAAKFLSYIYPSLIGMILFDALKSFMMAQGEFRVPMYANNLTYMTTPFYCWLFMDVCGWKIFGLAMARNAVDLQGALYLYLYIKHYNIYPKTWIPPTKKALSGWTQYLKISLPMGAIQYFQWSFFELLTVIVGMLKDEATLAGHTSFSHIVLFFFCGPLGLSFTVNSILSNLVGARRVHQSQLFAKLAVITVAVLAISLSIIFTLLKPLIVPLFSANEEVAYWFAIVYDLYVHYYIFPDSYQANLSAILRSVGKQNFAASSFMIVYYGIGIPLSFFFVFVCNFGMPGVWYAEIVLGVAACSTFYWKISTLDWQGSIDEVSARLELEAQLLIELKKMRKGTNKSAVRTSASVKSMQKGGRLIKQANK